MLPGCGTIHGCNVVVHLAVLHCCASAKVPHNSSSPTAFVGSSLVPHRPLHVYCKLAVVLRLRCTNFKSHSFSCTLTRVARLLDLTLRWVYDRDLCPAGAQTQTVNLIGRKTQVTPRFFLRSGSTYGCSNESSKRPSKQLPLSTDCPDCCLRLCAQPFGEPAWCSALGTYISRNATDAAWRRVMAPTAASVFSLQ